MNGPAVPTAGDVRKEIMDALGVWGYKIEVQWDVQWDVQQTFGNIQSGTQLVGME